MDVQSCASIRTLIRKCVILRVAKTKDDEELPTLIILIVIAKNSNAHSILQEFYSSNNFIARIFELSELDSCDLTLKGSEGEEHEIESIFGANYLLNPENNTNLEFSCSFSNDLQLDAPFGSFKYMRKFDADMSYPSVLMASSLP